MKKAKSTLTALFSRYFKKLNAPYELTITNKESLQETLSFSLTKKSVYIFLASIFVSIFLLFSLVIFFTPLKYYVPGSQNNTGRKELLRLQNLSDSLSRINKLREGYIFNLLKVVNGESDQKRDTTLLSASDIKEAEAGNESYIDKASRYDYLKNQKPDSNAVNKKDSLVKAKNE